MRWYLNDASLQGQFDTVEAFGDALRALMKARRNVKIGLQTSQTFPQSKATGSATMREALGYLGRRDRNLTRTVMSWVDRNGPFIEDDREAVEDDYFEFAGMDVTDSGLGEAARRIAVGTDAATFSFAGGDVDFSGDPLVVDHGLAEDRLGSYNIGNVVDPERLVEMARESEPLPNSWPALVERARDRFPNLKIGDLHEIKALAHEPFDASLRDRFLELLRILDAYVAERQPDGSEGPRAREIIDTYFSQGDRSLFTGESSTNETAFEKELTFRRTSGERIFAPWHGKVSHRFFRLHFEWPLEVGRKELEIFYYGPKITKR